MIRSRVYGWFGSFMVGLGLGFCDCDFGWCLDFALWCFACVGVVLRFLLWVLAIAFWVYHWMVTFLVALLRILVCVGGVWVGRFRVWVCGLIGSFLVEWRWFSGGLRAVSGWVWVLYAGLYAVGCFDRFLWLA